MNASRRMTATGLIAASAVLAAAALFAPPSRALPRYSARYEQNCALCHVNPSGGGMRTTYATQKLVPDEIAWARTDSALGLPSPMIGKRLQIGTDFRELHVGSSDVNQRLDWFLMQADLYLGFQLDKRVTLYYDRGRQDSYELFGLAYFTPAVYVKAGRFVPSYGWKFDDHTMYVRSELGFMPPANSDVGVEAGYSQGPLDVQLAMVNGSRGNILDSDPGEAEVGNAVCRLRAGPIGAAIGAAGYHHPGTHQDEDTAGPYGYLTLSRLTWMGEADWRRQRITGAPWVESVVASNELSCLLHQGIELIGTYDFLDPDRKNESGARARWGGGLYFMPRPYATLEGLVRWTDYQNGIALTGTNTTEYLFQLHLLY